MYVCMYLRIACMYACNVCVCVCNLVHVVRCNLVSCNAMWCKRVMYAMQPNAMYIYIYVYICVSCMYVCVCVVCVCVCVHAMYVRM